MTAFTNGDFISTCAGVGGGWRRIVDINISAGDDCPGEWRKATNLVLAFAEWPVMVMTHVLLPVSLLME